METENKGVPAEEIVQNEQQTSNQTENETTETKEKKFKFNWLEALIATGIFAWNSYVIIHNFCVHDGYFWAVVGIIANVAIIYGANRMVSDLMPKMNIKVVYGIFAGIFIIGAIIGYKPFESYLEEASVPIVNQILQENIGEDAAECTDVIILKETGDYVYKGKAYLNNGNDLDINIEYYKRTKLIEVSIPY